MVDDPYQRLAVIARELEDHATAIWILEREQMELRAQIRALNSRPAQGSERAA